MNHIEISNHPNLQNAFLKPSLLLPPPLHSLDISTLSLHQYHNPPHTPRSINLNDSSKPFLSRSVSSIDVPPAAEENDKLLFGEGRVSAEKLTFLAIFESVFGMLRSGNRHMKRLFLLISLNVAYSTAELCIGLFTGRVGLVLDAFHLTFGCGLLTFSLFAMAASRKKPDGIYTYGYKRLEVLSAFTNAVFGCENGSWKEDSNLYFAS
ncbi:LOW QUALITY PROTEIN: metal tolerance protein C2 [Rosa chinensis]|uniref:LOW QUALITY PROTEIN: metal tolerance protein C2 n=1 Tax=Rosa chinensis TaxID=74649 RepID=UPI001AD9460C|nr:LOW QUALITY PROTEIN: metal tolerance protein C2 [Rosa chinensis]